MRVSARFHDQLDNLSTLERFRVVGRGYFELQWLAH